MKVIGPESLDAEIQGAPTETLVVLYLWGHQCPNCEIFARHYPKLKTGLEGLPIQWLKLNVYEHPDVGTRFGIYGIPNFLLFKGGKLLGRMSSFESDDYFTQVIREQCARIT